MTVKVEHLPNGDVKQTVYVDVTLPEQIYINGVYQDIAVNYEWPAWQRFYTIIPRRINNKWYTCRWVYRKWQLDSQGGYYIYGDTLDVLKGQ